MVRTQVISTVELRERMGVLTVKDDYSFRKDRPHHWLQRLCLGVLRRLGCYAQTSAVVSVRRHEIFGNTVLERILKQDENLFRAFDREPDTLLIGAEDYAKLMDEKPARDMFEFTQAYNVHDKYPGARFRGLKIKVVPWMRGVLVMPRD